MQGRPAAGDPEKNSSLAEFPPFQGKSIYFLLKPPTNLVRTTDIMEELALFKVYLFKC